MAGERTAENPRRQHYPVYEVCPNRRALGASREILGVCGFMVGMPLTPI
jgi:hypothetical protein